ncbi:unnamed protein product, partial [Prorocentrum cordatum]
SSSPRAVDSPRQVCHGSARRKIVRQSWSAARADPDSGGRRATRPGGALTAGPASERPAGAAEPPLIMRRGGAGSTAEFCGWLGWRHTAPCDSAARHCSRCIPIVLLAEWAYVLQLENGPPITVIARGAGRGGRRGRGGPRREEEEEQEEPWPRRSAELPGTARRGRGSARRGAREPPRGSEARPHSQRSDALTLVGPAGLRKYSRPVS